MGLHTRTTMLVMALAALLAACSGGSDDANDPASPEASDALQVAGTDQLAYEPDQLTAEAGEITIELTAEPGIRHDFVLEDGDEVVASAAAGESAVGTVTLDPGTYTFYCGVPGHREAGMVGTLEVAD